MGSDLSQTSKGSPVQLTQMAVAAENVLPKDDIEIHLLDNFGHKTPEKVNESPKLGRRGLSHIDGVRSNLHLSPMSASPVASPGTPGEIGERIDEVDKGLVKITSFAHSSEKPPIGPSPTTAVTGN